MSVSAPALRYVPYGELAGRPNVVVDGSPTEGTVLCLSHWPGIAAPPGLASDLSAEMALDYLRTFDRHGAARLVSNNHYDQDGLVGVFALVSPNEALARRGMLAEVARAGDFATTSSHDAAIVSMALAALADPARTPLGPLPADYGELTALLYTELLGRLPELCDHPGRFRTLWAEEDAVLRASEAAVFRNEVRIEEVPDLDLAVVTVPEDAPRGCGHRFGDTWVAGLHPIAVHNATERTVLLTVCGRNYELTFRYESWVQFRSRPVRARVDLGPLAERLTEAEAAAGTGGGGSPARWEAGPVSALTPVLVPAGGGESTLAPPLVRALVEQHLRDAPPVWDPYASEDVTTAVRAGCDQARDPLETREERSNLRRPNARCS